MADQDLIERLARHRTIGSAPRSELEWLAAHGYVRHFEGGELVRKGDPVGSLWVFLSGHITFSEDRGLGPRKVMEWRAGDVSGTLPYSRTTTSPGQGVILEAGDVFLLDREHFPALIRECPLVTETLVHNMLDRARVFTSSALQDEKMAALGRVSAGLAHELNNPASAVARSAKLLGETIAVAEETSRAIGAGRFTDAQLQAIDRVRIRCAARRR
jgi:signal transduction histidine kinase